MKNRLKRWLVCLAVAIGPAAAQGQAMPKMPRVGLVSPLAAAPVPSTVRTFRKAMHDLGYVEGRNIVIETRYAAGHDERFAKLFAELIQGGVDVLVTGSTLGAAAAKKATTTIPIVFAGVIDPLSAGIVGSLARPGANITGATFGVGGAGMGGKWVEFLKDAVPGMTHVAVLANPADPMTPQFLREIRSAARLLNVDVSVFDAGDDASLERAFADMAVSGVQGLIVPNHPYFATNRVKLVRYAQARRLPAIYFFNLFPDAGGLMSYGGNLEDSYRRAAVYVDRILKGTRPADLPVDQPTTFELVVNLKTAKALGLTIPSSLLLRADRVIE